MRKKYRASNTRKSGFGAAWNRPNRESDWIQLEADLSKPSSSIRRKSKAKAWIVRILGVICLCVSLPLALKWGYDRVFYENEEFVLRELKIQTDGALSESRISEIANVSIGLNLMELDLVSIERQVAKLPVVEKVDVTRQLPDTLNIMVRERFPVAWLSCPPLGIRPGDMERGFLLDEEGFLFRCLNLDDAMMALPIIEAFKITEPAEGTRIENQPVRSAVSLIAKSEKLFQGREMTIHMVKCRNEWSVECLYRQGLSVKFAMNRIDEGLHDLNVILKETEPLKVAVASVNVAAEKNIPVTFAEPIDKAAVSVNAMPVETNNEKSDNSRPDAQEKHLRSILKGG